MKLNFKIQQFALPALAALIGITTSWAADHFDQKIPGGLKAPDIPAGNALTQAKVDLGKKLFYDQSLSYSGQTSCASCHVPEHGFSDFTAVGFGSSGTPLRRNTPTVINAALLHSLFWDGRVSTLEDQIPGVFEHAGEAAVDMDQAVAILNASKEYPALFQSVFGGPPTGERFCQAVASFERTLLTGDTRFDRFLFQGDEHALTPAEKEGYAVFTGKGNCVACHKITLPEGDKLGVALFTDERFHNLGVGVYGRFMRDCGRYGVTGDRRDIGTFRTPPLRNVALTDPYMHDGSIATLEEVVDFYDRGGNPNSNLDPRMKPLHLTADEKRNLVSFLKALTDEKLAKTWQSCAQLQAQLKRAESEHR